MNSPSRRRVVRTLAAAAALPALAPRLLGRVLPTPETDDERIAGGVFAMAERRGLRTAPMGEIVAAVAREFLGRPYAAGTLETEGPERLVVNLRAFDCVTLVESALALARCIAAGAPGYEAFFSELTRIRYRRGVLDGYASRLHYFTDWTADNGRKGVVEDVTTSLGGQPVTKRMDFMTAHAERYPRLREASTYRAIAEQERLLSTARWSLIPPAKVAAVRGIQEGDILALAGARAGLDIDHTGCAVREGAHLFMLEASSAAGVVRIGGRPLEDLFKGRTRYSGLVVARPLRPDGPVE